MAASGGGGVSTTKIMTVADLAAGNVTPFELLPAPGSAKIVFPTWMNTMIRLNGATPFCVPANSGTTGCYWGDFDFSAQNSHGLLFEQAFDCHFNFGEAPSEPAGHTVFFAPTGIMNNGTFGLRHDGTALPLAEDLIDEPFTWKNDGNFVFPDVGGSVDAVTITPDTGASGYVDGDEFDVDLVIESTAVKAHGIVNAAIAGVPTSVTITSTPSIGYTTTTDQSTTATTGVGVNLALDITASTPGDNPVTLVVQTFGNVMDVPA